MKNELKKIKKYYGEEMMHLCRELFPTILEEEGALLRILEATFPHSRFLYEDIIHDNQIEMFKDFIYDKYNNPEEEKKETDTFISPFVLMDKAGYTLYECNTEADIQRFRKYYEKDEELCTFFLKRLETAIVFFAVKKNVDDIKRENFPNPDRQDEYGTSVISIQYRRGARNTLSVKNRYNHIVDNPDATFGNNLDNIIEGLNDSFERAYNLVHTGGHEIFELTNYARTIDGKYYKYNYEIGGICYGPDNIIIENSEIKEEYLEREKFLVIDNIIIDLVNKRIMTIDNSDKYIASLNAISKIEVVRIPDMNRKSIKLIMNNGANVIFEVDKYNRIISLYDDYTTEIGDNALSFSERIRKVAMPKAIKCGYRFLLNNARIAELSMPEIVQVGDSFLRYNINLRELNFPKLKIIGDCFMRVADSLNQVTLPSLVSVGDNFMDLNRGIEHLDLPNVKTVGTHFLAINNKISMLNMPCLEKASNNFLYNNKQIKRIYLPSLVSVGSGFFHDSMATEVELPNLVKAGNRFMENDIVIEKISLPSLVRVDDYFLRDNRDINSIYLPNLVITGYGFMMNNDELTELDLPNLEMCDSDFMSYNRKIVSINLPKIQCVGDGFLRYNYQFRQLILNDMDEVTTQIGKKYVRKR